MLDSAEIMLPQEPQAIAGITGGGAVAYNHSYSAGELEELVGENYGFIEQEKLSRMHDLNQLVGSSGTINKELLKGHNVIIVSDGLKTGFVIDLAVEFLKPIAIEKLIVAVPFASVQAVDRMHVLADDLYCLNVIEDYIDTDHYYDKQDVPDHETVLRTIEQIILKWK
jgi:predicted phosphoribosyltransferase